MVSSAQAMGRGVRRWGRSQQTAGMPSQEALDQLVVACPSQQARPPQPNANLRSCRYDPSIFRALSPHYIYYYFR